MEPINISAPILMFFGITLGAPIDTEIKKEKDSGSEVEKISSNLYSIHSRRSEDLYVSECDGAVARVEAHLEPTFAAFSKLISEMERAYGNSAVVHAEPLSIGGSDVRKNSVLIRWRSADISIETSMTEFRTNNQVSITYTLKNECFSY